MGIICIPPMEKNEPLVTEGGVESPNEQDKEEEQSQQPNKDQEFDNLLASELPVPEVPTREGESIPPADALHRYRTALYNYYIQYYARHYLKQLRTAYVQHFPQ